MCFKTFGQKIQSFRELFVIFITYRNLFEKKLKDFREEINEFPRTSSAGTSSEFLGSEIPFRIKSLPLNAKNAEKML
jgi:hypothetical protein